jgi:putative Mn2+ efflux pump MntP
MSFGTAMAVVGAIMRYAVSVHTGGFNIHVAGVILLIVGVGLIVVGLAAMVLGLLASLGRLGTVIDRPEMILPALLAGIAVALVATVARRPVAQDDHEP